MPSRALSLVALTGLIAIAACDAPENNNTRACEAAAARAEACLGEASELSCESDEDLAVAEDFADAACGEVQEEANIGCFGALQFLGQCEAPDLGCGSDLGKLVADAVWQSDVDHGTVPREQLYNARNVFYEPWIDAPEIFPGLSDLIANAKYEVNLETFEWDPWETSQTGNWEDDATWVILMGIKQLEDSLRAAEAAGEPIHKPVTVNFSINGKSGDEAMKKVWGLATQLENLQIEREYVEVNVGSHHYDIWGAVHSKVLTVDGYIGVVMGANPQKFNTLGRHWHDTAAMVAGEVGISLRHDFDNTWGRTDLVRTRPLTNAEGKTINGYQCGAELGEGGTPACVLGDAGVVKHVPQVESPDLDAIPELANACVPIIGAHRLPYSVLWGPFDVLSVDNPQNAAFATLMENAEDVIKIQSPNLNADHAKQRLLDAARRGVDVQIILSLGFNAGAERSEICRGGLCIGAGGANVDSVESLYLELDDPALCDNLQIRWNTKENGDPSWVQEAEASHTKYMTVDNALAMIGSANQDTVSWAIPQEANLVIDSVDATRMYDATIFDVDWERAAGNDVLDWAERIRNGEYDERLDNLLQGDAEGWAARVLDACGR